MFKIIKKTELVPKIKQFDFEAPQLSKKGKPGQFVIIRINEQGERFPLTLAGTDEKNGTIRLVFNEVGKSSRQLGKLEEGDSVLNLVGPLGRASEIEKFGTVLCVGGGVMTGPLYYYASELKKAGNEIIGVVGARIKDLLIFTNEMKEICKEFYISTDDGSEGEKGLDFLKEVLEKQKIDHVHAMSVAEATIKTVSEMTKPYGIKTMVSLAPIMVDGTGMCGCCRVSIDNETKFACVDGPEFDGHKIDWDLLISRKRTYLPEERLSCLCKEKFK